MEYKNTYLFKAIFDQNMLWFLLKTSAKLFSTKMKELASIVNREKNQRRQTKAHWWPSRHEILWFSWRGWGSKRNIWNIGVWLWKNPSNRLPWHENHTNCTLWRIPSINNFPGQTFWRTKLPYFVLWLYMTWRYHGSFLLPLNSAVGAFACIKRRLNSYYKYLFQSNPDTNKPTFELWMDFYLQRRIKKKKKCQRFQA